MSGETDEDFQQELIALFVQEAQEWLQQIHVALDELQQGPPADRHLKLAQTMKAGLTNLGGSAATISLHTVEQASFSGLPLVDAVANPSIPPSASAFVALCKQLGQIHDALTHATGMTFDAASAMEETAATPVPAHVFLSALQDLLGRLTGRAGMPSQVTRTLIAQIDGMTRNGVTQCDASSLREGLERGAQAEQVFTQAVQQLGPLVADGIGRMARASAAQRNGLSGEWKALTERAGELWSASQQVTAVEARTFFTGLQSFLALVIAQRVAPPAAQFQHVEHRLRALPAVIQEWAESGRQERGAIEALLAAM